MKENLDEKKHNDDKKENLGDPNKFSFYEPGLEHVKESFYEITNHKNEQKLLSLLTKGVLHTSEVVKYKDNYYSHIQDLDKVESSNKNLDLEIRAEIFILSEIFCNIDRMYYGGSDAVKLLNPKNKERSGDQLEHHNIVVDQRNQKFSIFDLTNSDSWIGKIIREKSLKDDALEFMFHINIKYIIEIEKDENKNCLIFLRLKTEKILKIFTEENSKLFEILLKKSEIDLSDDKKNILYEQIKRRLLILLSIVEKMENNDEK